MTHYTHGKYVKKLKVHVKYTFQCSRSVQGHIFKLFKKLWIKDESFYENSMKCTLVHPFLCMHKSTHTNISSFFLRLALLNLTSWSQLELVKAQSPWMEL